MKCYRNLPINILNNIMNKEFGWAIIGAGAIAKTVAKEITKTKRHKIVSVYSRTMSRANDFAKQFSCHVYDNFNDAICCDGVEGVYLATPHSCHFKEIMRCIEKGVPVLSEKAFTINNGQNKTIIYNNKRHSYVSEGMWTRYNPITLKVKDIVQSGRLGAIKEVYAEFSYPYNLSTFSDRVVKREYGGGALLDIGVYTISYMQMLFGKPDRIESSMKLSKYGTDVSDEITLYYDNGPICHLKCSLASISLCSAKIIGDKGYISMPLFYRPTRAKVVINGNKTIIKCKAGYIHEFDAVVSDIRNGKTESDLISLSDSLEVMEIMDSIRYEHGLIYPIDIESNEY